MMLIFPTVEFRPFGLVLGQALRLVDLRRVLLFLSQGGIDRGQENRSHEQQSREG